MARYFKVVEIDRDSFIEAMGGRFGLQPVVWCV